MKARKLIASVAIAACLAACGKTSADTRTNLEKFRDSLQDNNVTLTTDDNWVNTLFFGSNAFLYDFTEAAESQYEKVDTGYLGTDQGIFKYTVNNNKVELGRCESVTTEATVSDFMTFPSDLVADLSLWEATDTENVYTTSTMSLISQIAEIGGDADYYYYLTDISLDVTDTENVRLVYSLNSVPLTITFSDFGSTKEDFIDDFYKNPTTVSNPTEFPEDMKASMAKILSKELPFYDMSYAYEFDSDMQTLSDYGCGDQTSAYDKLLVRDGFTLDSKNSREAPDSLGRIGFVDYIYYRRVFENNAVVSIEYVEVGYTSGYYMDDYYGTDYVYEKMYPQGRFSITYISNEFFNEDRYNAYLASLWDQYGGFGDYVPFHMSENTYFLQTDYKEYASLLGVSEYMTFKTSYSSAETAKADCQQYYDDLVAGGYLVYSGGSEVGTDAIEIYKNNDDYSANITIDYTDGSTDFTITVFIGDPVMTPETITWNQFKTSVGTVAINYPAIPTLPEDMDELEEVTYADMTEIQAGMREKVTADKVYLSYYYGLQYSTKEEAVKNAGLLAASYAEMGYGTTGDYNLEEDEMISFILDTSTYAIESTVVIEENAVVYAFVVYDPIRA